MKIGEQATGFKTEPATFTRRPSGDDSVSPDSNDHRAGHLTALALYAGTALGLEDAHERDVPPLFRRGGAAASFEGYDAQLDRLETEPGVRQQL